jgi:PST family polysaccharide transporter/lipopolysaccharide exporter
MSTTQKAINGGKWVTTSTITSTAFQFLQVAIVARLVDPSAFGLVSISTMIITFFSTFSNLGFSNSIISEQEEDPEKLSTIYYVNLGLGLLMFLLIFLGSPFIISFFHEPRLDKVLKLASCFFLIVYFGQIYNVLLQKELQFKSIAIIEIIAIVSGTVTTITLAYSGFQEMALIYGQLLTQLIKTTLQVIAGQKLFKPRLYFDIRKIKSHIQFGAYNLADGVLGFIQGNSDNLIIGSVLGVKALGYYSLASQLAVLPISRINPIILQVAYPMIAKIKDNAAELKKTYIQILDLITYFNLPLLAGLFITAQSVVPVIYGPGWQPTVILIQILTGVSFFLCLGHPLFTLVFSKGKPKLLFFLNAFTLVVKIPLVYYFGKNWGVAGVAVGYLVAMMISAAANFVIVKLLIGSFVRDFLVNLTKPLAFCLAMVFVIYLYKTFVGFEGTTHMLIQIAIGGAIFIGLTLKYKYSVSDLKAFRKN